MTFHKEGIATLLVVLAFDALVAALAHAFLPDVIAWVLDAGALLLLGLVINFFRLPKRQVGELLPGDVLCPSDGKVVVIEEVEEPEYFNDRRIQVSVFMSPLNVHAQWAPVAGEVLEARYHPGKYLVAWHPKSSTENERTTHVIQGPHGPVLFRQIAGAVARRICWYMKPGQTVSQGEEVGFIKFGSRIDVFLPLDAEILVDLEDVVTGKETILARIPSQGQ